MCLCVQMPKSGLGLEALRLQGTATGPDEPGSHTRQILGLVMCGSLHDTPLWMGKHDSTMCNPCNRRGCHKQEQGTATSIKCLEG